VLIWVAEQAIEQQKTLREMDDKLFSWSATLFVTSYGALAGISGLTTKVWGGTWRLLLVAGIAILVGGLVTLAWQLHGSLLRKQGELKRIIEQLSQVQRYPVPPPDLGLDSGLFFYLRWGIITIFGVIAATLTWLTFG
jgi:hypothetical protein